MPSETLHQIDGSDSHRRIPSENLSEEESCSAASPSRFALASLAAGAAQAQTWPFKPVRYIVPFPPAGATDILARIMAEKLSGPLGQSVVVENRPGAAGNVGTEFVAKSAPDGYTILQLTVAQSISATLYEKLNYGLEKDLIPVAMIALVPNVMIVNPSVPANSVAEFIALARSRPGKINFASSGSGTSIHMSAEMFKMLTGVNIVHIPTRAAAPRWPISWAGRST